MATGRRTEIIQACAIAAAGLLNVGFEVLGHVRNPERPVPYDLAWGLLLLVMAAQVAIGVSKQAQDWVGYAFALVLVGKFLPHVVESAVENVLARSILAATALVMLLLAVGWRRSHPRRT